jgi:di/tricarboxylate transporter
LLQGGGLPGLVDVSKLVLAAGDVLLLSGSTKWGTRHRNNRNFALISTALDASPPKRNRALVAVALGTVMIITQIIPGAAGKSDWIHLWPSAILTTMLMLATGCLSGDQARRSILWEVYLAIAAAFGVSNAMESTGVANEFAQLFISIARVRCSGRCCHCNCTALPVTADVDHLPR